MSLMPLISVSFFAVIALAVIYVSRRTAQLFNSRSVWFYVFFFLLLVYCFAGMMLIASPKAVTPLLHAVTVSGTNICGVLMYLFASLVVTDIVRIFMHYSARKSCMIALAITLAASLYSFVNAAVTRTRQTEIPIEGLSRDVTVAQLTDMHLGHFHGAKHVRKVVDMVNAANPDFVVITGDLFDSWYNRSAETISALRNLNAPTFFIVGNHDVYVDADGVKELVRSLGNVRVLENEVLYVAGIQLVGLDYMAADEKELNKFHFQAPYRNETIEQVMGELSIEPSWPTVAIHHTPDGAEYVADAGVDLFLAGHTHGGQFFPVTIIDRILFDHMRWLDKEGDMQVYVSCGTGTTGPQMRNGTISEVTILKLIPNNN